jgi:hypothetical protein
MRSTYAMHASELSLAQRQYLQRLNDKLTVIERQAKREALTLITALEARVHDPADWLSDYELELEVSFWLREDDPAFKEDDDNILVTLKESLKLTLKEYLKPLRDPADWFGIDDGINHNAFQHRDGHPCRASATAGSIIACMTIPTCDGRTCSGLGISG